HLEGRERDETARRLVETDLERHEESLAGRVVGHELIEAAREGVLGLVELAVAPLEGAPYRRVREEPLPAAADAFLHARTGPDLCVDAPARSEEENHDATVGRVLPVALG